MTIYCTSNNKMSFSILISALEAVTMNNNFIADVDVDGKSVIINIIYKKGKINRIIGKFSFLSKNISDEYYEKNYKKVEKIDIIRNSLRKLLKSKITKIIRETNL